MFASSSICRPKRRFAVAKALAVSTYWGSEVACSPLAIDCLVQDGVDNVLVHSTIAIDESKSWTGKRAEDLKVVPDS